MARHGRVNKKLRSKSFAPVKINRKDSTINKWNKREDIPLDDEDHFHQNRDKILLNDEDESVNEEEGDDEVFALDGLESSSEEEDANDVDPSYDNNFTDTYENRAAKLKSPALSKKTSPSESSSSDDYDDDDEVWGWGRKSAYYSSNAQQIDSDDDEANEMEEQEARRLQSKLRDSMKEEDFGVDDIQDLIVPDFDNLSFEKVESADTTSKDDKTIIQNLCKTHPETIALANDFEDAALAAMMTQNKIDELGDAAYEGKSELDGMFHLYHQAQLMYASMVAFYLYLRASKKYTSNPDLLNSHPIMERLLVLKRGILTIESLNLLDSEDESSFEDDYSLESDELEGLARDSMLEKDQLEELLREEGLQLRKRKEISPSNLNKLTKAPSVKQKGKKKAVADRDNLLPELPEPTYKPEKKAIRIHLSPSNVFGEATSLDYADAADKGARRKTLQFHTSKIENTSARRHGARNAISGDDDIPYRKRKKEKEQALLKQRRNLGQGGDDLDDLDPEPRENAKKRNRDGLDEGSSIVDEDDYYDLVHKSKKLRKEQKKEDYELQKEMSRPDYDVEVASGQRSVSRAILANKGLTPHRAKSVRNPRVKKRKKFDAAKKKLSSQKAVYKGGLKDVGRYEGERSGITKVAKGIRF